MSTPQEVLLEKIKAPEIELIAELQKQEEELFYEIRKSISISMKTSAGR
ncbi:hypothetical protein ACH50O_07195 [Methylomonas sp. 2BW1-5-20]